MHRTAHHQILTCLDNEFCSFIYCGVGALPITVLDGVADCGEESAIVPGPLLWCEEDMLELLAVLELESLLVS